MITKYFKIAQVAQLYYQKEKPDRNYTTEAARKQFIQDKHIDKELLKKVFEEIMEEQLSIF